MEELKSKITFESVVVDGKVESITHSFEPELDPATMKIHWFNLMNNFLSAGGQTLSAIPIMRSPTEEELAAHIYVFKTDDTEDDEHKLYRSRKNMYEQSTRAFKELMSSMFPDIEYIEASMQYQQDLAFDETRSEEDHENNQFDVEAIVSNVRANYDKIIEEMMKKANETAKAASEALTEEGTEEADDEEE